MLENKKVGLVILDGWGYGKKDYSDAIYAANTPFFDSLLLKYANSKLNASGEAVGLPEGQMGNSEVGHMNLGAGRVVYQELVRINKAVREHEIDNNKTILAAFDYATKNNKQIHFIGLVSDGGVHSHIYHLKGLLSLAAKHNLKDVFVHAFMDGRDTDPKSGLAFVKDLEEHLEKTTGVLASSIGRYYAMDRDKRWERVRIAYDAMVNGVGVLTDNIQEGIEQSYKNDVTDEFIKPIIKSKNGKAITTIKDGDVVICFNYRTDRGREITQVLTQTDFPEQEMKKMNLHYVTMTTYDESFVGINVVFTKDNLTKTLGEVLESAGKTQIRIAETEKYPHVTFFFSGGREEPFNGEKRLLCPSPKVATYDLQPEMSAEEIKNKILPELKAKSADFICLNFANTDMVGHTGVFSAAVKAAETVDQNLKDVIETGVENGYSFIVLADHGNAEFIVNPDGSPNTAHSTNLVPCIIVDKDIKSVKDGVLGDVAPTILKMMNVEIPSEMTGNILI